MAWTPAGHTGYPDREKIPNLVGASNFIMALVSLALLIVVFFISTTYRFDESLVAECHWPYITCALAAFIAYFTTTSVFSVTMWYSSPPGGEYCWTVIAVGSTYLVAYILPPMFFMLMKKHEFAGVQASMICMRHACGDRCARLFEQMGPVRFQALMREDGGYSKCMNARCDEGFAYMDHACFYASSRCFVENDLIGNYGTSTMYFTCLVISVVSLAVQTYCSYYDITRMADYDRRMYRTPKT